jgi:hypothetical protein
MCESCCCCICCSDGLNFDKNKEDFRELFEEKKDEYDDEMKFEEIESWDDPECLECNNSMCSRCFILFKIRHYDDISFSYNKFTVKKCFVCLGEKLDYGVPLNDKYK